MLLLAPELLAIELCVGTAGSELESFDTIDGVNVAKQYGAVRMNAAVWAMSPCGSPAVCGRRWHSHVEGRLCICSGPQ